MLNWIIIGIGDIATRRVIPAIQAESRSCLHGVVTRDPAKAAPYATRVWQTLDEALTDPEVQAVYVGTPVFLHAPQSIQSLRAGKHVLCEKPMAMSEAEARSMLNVAEQSEKTLGVAYYPPTAGSMEPGAEVGWSIQPRPEADRSSTLLRIASTS